MKTFSTILRFTALAAVLALSTSTARAWWGGPGWGGSDWGPFTGDSFGDFDMSMSGGGHGYGRGRGYGYGYGHPYYGGWGGPWGYGGYPYGGWGAPVIAPYAVTPAAPAAPESK